MQTFVDAIYLADTRTLCPLPFFVSPVEAGFPSPADDYLDESLDLNEFLIQNPDATFIVRARGDSMDAGGIRSGDLLVVDKSLDARDGDIVIAIVDGHHLVKRLRFNNTQMRLVTESSRHPHVEIATTSDVTIWGVVTCIIRQTRGRR